MEAAPAPATGRKVLLRLTLCGLVQTAVEMGIAFLLFAEAGRWAEEPWRNSVHPVMSMVFNLQRALTLKGLFRRLRRPRGSSADDEPVPQGAKRSVNIFVFVSMMLSVWYVMKFLMRGSALAELGLFLPLAALNLAQAHLWSRVQEAEPPQSKREEPLELPEVEGLVATAAAMGGLTDRSCLICLGDFAEGDELGRLPCQHLFHETCVREWLARSAACPLRCKALAPPAASPREVEERVGRQLGELRRTVELLRQSLDELAIEACEEPSAPARSDDGSAAPARSDGGSAGGRGLGPPTTFVGV